MTLNDTQVNILKSNLSEATNLTDFIYRASTNPEDQQMTLEQWQCLLKRLHMNLVDARETISPSTIKQEM